MICKMSVQQFVFGRREKNHFLRKDVLRNAITVRVKKSRRIRWTGNVTRMRERRETYRGYCWGNLKERGHLGDPVTDVRIILSWIFKKWDVGIWTGASLLRIGTGGGHL